MTNFAAPPPPPPPPMPNAGVATKAGPAGWAAVAAGVLGLLGLVLPWFTPKLSKPVAGVTKLGASSYHAWSGFFFLVAAPVLLILFGVLWFQAMRGQHNSRFAGAADPVRAMSIQSIGAGVIALALALVSFPLMKSHYKNWSLAAKEFKAAGSNLEQNPQLGLYAVILGAVVLIATGALGLVMKPVVANGAGPGAGPSAYPGPQGGFGAPQQGGFGGPAQRENGPVQGFGGPDQGYVGPAQGGPQAGGFPPPPPPPGN